GGGLYSDTSVAVLHNCTIAFNQAGEGGGGISGHNGTVTLSSTIVAQNVAPVQVDLGSSTTDYEVDHSLIGNKDGPGANFHTNGATLPGSPGNEIDPLLAPLANTGGPTQTHPLKKGSPCFNMASNPDTLATDQRGPPFARQLGHAVDIGAFERS